MMLNSDRLQFRPPSKLDITNIVQSLNDWDITKWLIKPPFPFFKKDFRPYIKIDKTLKKTPNKFCIFDTEDNFVGMIEFSLHSTLAEITYWICPEFGGKGYARESISIINEYIFDKFDTDGVYAWVDPENIKSQSVLIKSGFQLINDEKRAFPNKIGNIDRLLFAKMRI